jgi:hypothetical protein
LLHVTFARHLTDETLERARSLAGSAREKFTLADQAG